MTRYYNFFYDWAEATKDCTEKEKDFIMKHDSRFCCAANDGAFLNDGIRLNHFYLTKVAWSVGDNYNSTNKNQFRTRLLV